MGNDWAGDGTGMFHLLGNFALIRGGIIRAFATSALFAGAFALAGCDTDAIYQMPTRAMKELSPEMLAHLEQKNMPKDSPVLVRLFKEESELEVWKQDTTGRYELLKVYPICRWSGELGPKVKEGDRQAPEGFYTITPGLMNPNSNYYLAINTGFPNAYDKANGYTGAFLMIHGDCSSRGCYAMTDEQIGEIYALAREAFLGGQKSFQIQAYPFRMTAANMARHRTNPNMAFWKMLKVGDDHFMVSHLEPKVDVCEKHYVFDAQSPAGSTKSLAFTPSGRCPVYEIDQTIAGPALEKQRNDEYQIAELTSHNSTVAPITMGTDGGMNRVFASKLEQPSAVYDDEGHAHAPPIHPGMPAPTLSTAAAVAVPDTGPAPPPSGFFSGLFGAKPSGTQTKVASTDTGATGSSGFFGNLFKPKNDTVPPPATANQPATEPAKPRPAALASLRAKPAAEPRKTEPAKSEPQVADAPKAKATPQAAAAPPPANSNGLLKGAQPVVPAGSFDGRWAGLQ
jgi:murein L,D-transpeptidase YafK